MASSALQYKTLILHRDRQRRVDILCLNRPKNLNAMNGQMITELLHYFNGVITDDLSNGYIPRIIVIKGKGKSFCAGLDLFNPGLGKQTGPAASLKTQRRISSLILLMRRCKPPIVSLLHGPTVGGGFALALASDIRLGTKDLKMNVAMATIGLSGCDVGISYFLPRLIGGSVASQMMLTGEYLYGQRAYDLGLLMSVHDTYKDMEDALEKLLKQMLNLGEYGLWLTKNGINASYCAGSLEAQISLEDRQQVLCPVVDESFKDKVVAFRNKGKRKSKL